MRSVSVIGGGLAGSEAAWQLAIRGVSVTLWEMKPELFSPAHSDDHLAELVCSNSFGSQRVDTGAGLLQWEGHGLGSLILEVAARHSVPAGNALAVDRRAFASAVTEQIDAHPRILLRRQLCEAVPEDRPVLVCTGPLTATTLVNDLQTRLGGENFYFYDAIAPIVIGESINRDIAFMASRYEEGEGDYLNCPLSREQYYRFVEVLLEGETYPTHAFEKLFQGCQPIETIASRGSDSLAFGPMRPVGLRDPRTGERPFAVLQLRREDRDGQLWNMVGFQTKLRQGEQKRIFRMIPGLEQAEFARLGSIHRNTFLNAPELLTERLMVRGLEGLFVGGQLTGVEGYLESTICGLMAALFLYGELIGEPVSVPPCETMVGGLLRYLREAAPKVFQPMNANFGLLPPLAKKVRKKERRMAKALRAQEAFRHWIQGVPLGDVGEESPP